MQALLHGQAEGLPPGGMLEGGGDLAEVGLLLIEEVVEGPGQVPCGAAVLDPGDALVQVARGRPPEAGGQVVQGLQDPVDGVEGEQQEGGQEGQEDPLEGGHAVLDLQGGENKEQGQAGPDEVPGLRAQR